MDRIQTKKPSRGDIVVLWNNSVLLKTVAVEPPCNEVPRIANYALQAVKWMEPIFPVTWHLNPYIGVSLHSKSEIQCSAQIVWSATSSDTETSRGRTWRSSETSLCNPSLCKLSPRQPHCNYTIPLRIAKILFSKLKLLSLVQKKRNHTFTKIDPTSCQCSDNSKKHFIFTS